LRARAHPARMPARQERLLPCILCDGDPPEDVARREAQEEAGSAIRDLGPICRYLASPGGSSESVQIFCGRADSRGIGGIHGLAVEHEDIRVETVPFEQARERLLAGRFGNAPAIIAMQWLVLNRDELRRRWLA